MPPRTPTSRTLALGCARICHDKKASDITILDMRQLTFITDYFVICSTESDRQSKAIAEALEEFMRARGRRRVGEEPRPGSWVVQDFSVVVCHIFTKEARGFYDLESLWQEAPRVAFKPAARKRASRESGI